MKRYLGMLVLLCSLLFLCACTAEPSEYGALPSDGDIRLVTQYPVYAPDTERIWYTIENHAGVNAEFGTAHL